MHPKPGAAHYTRTSHPDIVGARAQPARDALRKLPVPNRAVLCTSGRTSNEAAFLYRLLARRLGTNNLPDGSNMCHESPASQ